MAEEEHLTQEAQLLEVTAVEEMIIETVEEMLDKKLKETLNKMIDEHIEKALHKEMEEWNVRVVWDRNRGI